MSKGPTRGAGESGDCRIDIVVAIAGRQHADQLTAALVEDDLSVLLHHHTQIRAELTATLAGRHRLHWFNGAIARGSTRVLPSTWAEPVAYHAYRAFDRRVARALPRIAPRAVIGYENGALATFRAAKARGIPTILDAASVHHRAQAEPDTAFHRAVNARKDAELALADHILTGSSFARASYLAAGVEPERVHVLPLGFDPGAFGPEPMQPRDGPLRLAFVGRFTRTKGADVLVDALDTLAAAGLAFDCRIAADRALSEDRVADRLVARATLFGKLDQTALADLYRWADLLVLPSRFDSFGLVVPEALACGLPVAASANVGAGDLLSEASGFRFPAGDAGALAELLAELARNPSRVRAMRPAAVAAARGTEWPAYRRRAAHLIRASLGWERA